MPIKQMERVMSHAEGSRANIDRRRERVSRLTSSAKETAIFLLGSGFLLITLWIALPLTAILTIAMAHGREDKNTALSVAALPSGGAP